MFSFLNVRTQVTPAPLYLTQSVMNESRPNSTVRDTV